jgi:LysR family glycine cleavage system transcriptional activator
MKQRIPPVQCLQSFEALARLRSVNRAAEELYVTPSAISHRIKQLEHFAGTKLFVRADYSLTTDGATYIERVRNGLNELSHLPNNYHCSNRRRLRVAAPPTFARSFLMPKLRQFVNAYPEIDLSLQVNIALFDTQAEDSDFSIRFGTGYYSDVDSECLLIDEVTPLASPLWVRENGPFERPEDLEGQPLLRSALEPWKTWFGAHNLSWPEPIIGSLFNDTGLVCDAASQGLGVGLIRLKLARPWLDTGQLVHLYPHSVASPHAHYLCWQRGAMDRWECNTFYQWIKSIVS